MTSKTTISNTTTCVSNHLLPTFEPQTTPPHIIHRDDDHRPRPRLLSIPRFPLVSHPCHPANVRSVVGPCLQSIRPRLQRSCPSRPHTIHIPTAVFFCPVKFVPLLVSIDSTFTTDKPYRPLCIPDEANKQVYSLPSEAHFLASTKDSSTSPIELRIDLYG